MHIVQEASKVLIATDMATMAVLRSTSHDWQFPRLRRKLDPDVVPASSSFRSGTKGKNYSFHIVLICMNDLSQKIKEEKLHWWPYLLAVGHDQEDTVQAFAHRHFSQLNYVLVAAS